MAHPMGESKVDGLRVDFDRRLKLEFRGSKVTSDAGLLPYRELDHALELTEMAGDVLADSRSGKNGRNVDCWHKTEVHRLSWLGLPSAALPTFGGAVRMQTLNLPHRLSRQPDQGADHLAGLVGHG